MNVHTPEILIADEDPTVRLALSQAFSGLGHRVRATNSASTVLKWADGADARLAIVEAATNSDQALEVLRHIRRVQPGLPIIMTSPQSTLQAAVRAVEIGAFDYLPKPLDLNVLLATARRALAPPSDTEARRAQAKAARDERLALIGRSAPMLELYRTLARLTPGDLEVLVLGECGTGKAAVARALHEHGRRRTGAFVPLSLAALEPGEVAEALLGRDGAAGRLAEADGGVLFLDGVDDLSWEAQTRLLRVLDGLGGSREARRPSVRIVASAHPDLLAHVETGRFRRDLFLRLAVATLRLPPLRDRAVDIGDLARALLARAQRDGLPGKSLHRDAVARLRQYGWPGNVRELDNLMRRVSMLYAEPQITAEIIARELADQAGAALDAGPAALPDTVRQVVSRYIAEAAGRPETAAIYARLQDDVERPLLDATLAATHGNQVRAAQLLGINRNTLRRKMEAHGLPTRRTASEA